MPVVQNNVTITTPDGAVEAVFSHPAGAKAWPAVIIHTDAFGLRPAFRSMAARLAAEGYAVLVPVALFYMLYDWTRLVNSVLELVPPAWRERFDGFMHDCDDVLGEYLRGQMLVMLVAAICCFWIGRILEGYARNA